LIIMLKTNLILFLFSFLLNVAYSQNSKIKLGRVTQSDLKMTVYMPDTAAEAVVLYDEADITMTEQGFFILNRERNVKILKQKGIDSQRAFSLILDINYQNLIFLQARVIQPDSSTILVKDNEVFFNKISDDRSEVKIVFPNLKEGSIIDLNYTLSVSSLDLLKWSFQENIPIRRNVLLLDIPSWVEFEYLYKGLLDYKTGYKKKKQFFGSTYEVPSIIMDTVPAFHEENFMPSQKDILCGVSFNWKKMTVPNTKKEYKNDVNFMIKQLTEHKKFGTQYEKKSNYGAVWKAVKPLLINKNSLEDTLKTVYNYVSNNILWIDNYFSAFVEKSLDNSFKNKKANSGEMNLMMVACLKEAGVNCFPLLISTFEHGTPSAQFLSVYQFDHVLCYVESQGKKYFLDAGNTFRNIYLPRRISLNGQGWLMDKKNAKWIDLPRPLSILKTDGTFILEKDGIMKGTLTKIYEGYVAVDEREHIDKDKQQEYIKKEFSEHFTDFKLLKTVYENTENLYLPLKRTIECDINDATTVLDSLIFLNPFSFGKFNLMSFSNDKREHPIQFTYPINEYYSYNLTLPDGYKLEELPQNFSKILGKNDALFSLTSSFKKNQIHIEVNYTINKLFFDVTAFKELKSFFDSIIKKSNEQIVLKRK
jgi:Domain of Unknown Function with PDB structure (DUF3857)